MTCFHEPSFWDGRQAYKTMAHAFTSLYARDAWELAQLPPGSRVLDIAAGAGAMTVIAAQAGAEVLAIDFSPAMVEAVTHLALPGVEARVMDGQALDLPDATFDAAFSMFGIMLFADWQRGLAEMARVVRPDGIGCVGTWADSAGAATNLLLDRLTALLFPQVERPSGPDGMLAWRTPELLSAAMMSGGFQNIEIDSVTHDFTIEPVLLAEPDQLFQFSPLWPVLSIGQRDAILVAIKAAVEANDGELLVPSPALIAVGTR